jgi:hypothetical protein
MSLPTKLATIAKRVVAVCGEWRASPTARGWRRACYAPGTMRNLARALLLLVVTTTAACNTPSVPIPPPLGKVLGFELYSLHMVTFSGQPYAPHAKMRFFIINEIAGDGAIATAGDDGAFTTVPFVGDAGDSVRIYYETPAGDRSQDLCTTLDIRTGLISTVCR